MVRYMCVTTRILKLEHNILDILLSEECNELYYVIDILVGLDGS